MLNRGDNLQFMRIQNINTNFGIWRMGSFGKFTTRADKWAIWSDPEIDTNDDFLTKRNITLLHLVIHGQTINSLVKLLEPWADGRQGRQVSLQGRLLAHMMMLQKHFLHSQQALL
jgi:hypothetical protein